MGVVGYYGPNVQTSTHTPSGGGRPGGGSATAAVGQAYQSSGQSMNEWIQEALGPTGNVHDVPGVETVDYTSDPVNTEQATVQEIINSNMSEVDKWRWLYDLQSQWETEQYPLGTGNLGVSSPFALTAQNLGNPQGLAWQAASPNEPGAQEIEPGVWKKPILSGLGQHLFEREEGLPSLGGEGASQSLRDIAEDYYSTRTEQERFEEDQRYDYGNRGRRNDDYMSSGSYSSLAGLSHPLAFFRGRPENINPAWRDVAGTPMLPVAGSGAGASMATADELYSLASGNKAFSMDPNAQGILAILNS